MLLCAISAINIFIHIPCPIVKACVFLLQRSDGGIGPVQSQFVLLALKRSRGSKLLTYMLTEQLKRGKNVETPFESDKSF